jgi:hypothetical protein
MLKMKRYIEQHEPIDLGFVVKKLFTVDVDRIRSWYSDLERDYGDWKFIIGENHHVWAEPIVDLTGTTGHILPDDAYYYTLCWNSDEPGPKPFEQGQAKPEYKDDDNDELNPRMCFIVPFGNSIGFTFLEYQYLFCPISFCDLDGLQSAKAHSVPFSSTQKYKKSVIILFL